MCEIGGRWTATGEALTYARGKFVCDARAAQMTWLIDGAFMQLTDEPALERESRACAHARLQWQGRRPPESSEQRSTDLLAHRCGSRTGSTAHRRLSRCRNSGARCDAISRDDGRRANVRWAEQILSAARRRIVSNRPPCEASRQTGAQKCPPMVRALDGPGLRACRPATADVELLERPLRDRTTSNASSVFRSRTACGRRFPSTDDLALAARNGDDTAIHFIPDGDIDGIVYVTHSLRWAETSSASPLFFAADTSSVLTSSPSSCRRCRRLTGRSSAPWRRRCPSR